jgi:pyruvate,water dikinase
MATERKKELVLWFDQIDNSDVAIVGGKNSSLGEMYKELTSKGIHIPNGFAVTAHSYFHHLTENKIDSTIRETLKGLDVSNVEELQKRGAMVRDIVLSKQLPVDLQQMIVSAYESLEKIGGKSVAVAVRSSATAEDLPNASFAGQHDSFLNICGKDALLDACKRCMASLFNDRAISYRVAKGFDHFRVGLSVGVQLMVRSDLASAGVMFTIDTESGFGNSILINGSYGLGENVVQGSVNPDEWLVFKPLLGQFQSIIKRTLGSKEKTMVYNNTDSDLAHHNFTRNTSTSAVLRQLFCLTDEEVWNLSKWGCVIEDHYSKKKGSLCPMDIEWAKDGKTGQMFIVQARPETVHSQANHNILQSFALTGDASTFKSICSGSAVGSRIGSGEAVVIHSVSEHMESFKGGQVLVTEMTDPDWEPILKRASAVVTNRGGRTCHAAIISRELGIPCLVGCGNATERISSGQAVTVDCSTGEKGNVFIGLIPFAVKDVDLKTVPTTKTKISLLLANPDLAFEYSFMPNDGVGLARMEFIISSWIRVHPMALLHPEKLTQDERDSILKLTLTNDLTPEIGQRYFVDHLAEGMGIIAAAFWPKSVILRFSDFKTDEYASLLGGHHFEPKEDNPMLGWRGASRYYDENYKQGFALECQSVRVVREKLGLTNLWVMVPFVRTVEELHEVIAEMESNGLKRGEPKDTPLKLIMMCEVPSNAILAAKFLEFVDGFSIGSNDLTQLTLGVDRNSARVARLFDERDEAVKKLISSVIQEANLSEKYIGICGQAPSDYPDFCSFLISCGIGSISVQPDRIVATHILVAEKEKIKI